MHVLASFQCGVNANSTDRLLLQPSKPSLYTNVDCTALVAAIVNRQVSVVRLLLQVFFLITLKNLVLARRVGIVSKTYKLFFE